jgi:hypothetical protein
LYVSCFFLGGFLTAEERCAFASVMFVQLLASIYCRQ